MRNGILGLLFLWMASCQSARPPVGLVLRPDEWVLLRGVHSGPEFDDIAVLVRPGKNGAIGWKLGVARPLQEAMREGTFLQLDTPLPPELPVRDGGPVESSILSFVYRDPENGSIHFSRHLPTLRLILQREPHNVLVFRGYSGWAPGQLEAEIARGLWVKDGRPPEAVFAH